MSYLTIHHQPQVPLDYLVLAFGGWADAGDAATTAIKFLQRKLGAKKFAEIDPEEFYDFAQTRPYSSRTKDGRRRLRWPANEFSYWTANGSGTGTMAFLGVEPNLKWRTFSNTIADLAKEHGVKTVIHVGALLDAVPHTREVKLSGSGTDTRLQQVLDDAGAKASNYQGPSGISSVVMEACTNQGMGYASVWGHTSHYLQAAPNYRVGYTLAKILIKLLELPLDLSELAEAATTFDGEVEEALSKDEQLRSYVTKLEGRYDDALDAPEILDPAEVVRDLEQFLRLEQRRRPGDGEGG